MGKTFVRFWVRGKAKRQSRWTENQAQCHAHGCLGIPGVWVFGKCEKGQQSTTLKLACRVPPEQWWGIV